MDSSWQVHDPQKTSEPDASPAAREIKPNPKTIPKRWIFWGIFAVLFFSIYTGGSYYVLFMQEKKVAKKIPIVPTAAPRASATPLPTPTAVPTVQPIQEASTVLKTYTNQTYGISLQYPPDMIINFNKTETGIDPFLILISYPDGSPSGQLKIDVQDSRYIGQSDVESRATIDLDLQKYAEKKWNLNLAYSDLTIPTRRVGELSFMTFADQPAYSFTVFGSYNDDRTYTKISPEHTYIFTENKDKKIIISYPTSDAVLKSILQTITFSD